MEAIKQVSEDRIKFFVQKNIRNSLEASELEEPFESKITKSAFELLGRIPPELLAKQGEDELEVGGAIAFWALNRNGIGTIFGVRSDAGDILGPHRLKMKKIAERFKPYAEPTRYEYLADVLEDIDPEFELAGVTPQAQKDIAEICKKAALSGGAKSGSRAL